MLKDKRVDKEFDNTNDQIQELSKELKKGVETKVVIRTEDKTLTLFFGKYGNLIKIQEK